jgi:hypothetical protein
LEIAKTLAELVELKTITDLMHATGQVDSQKMFGSINIVKEKIEPLFSAYHRQRLGLYWSFGSDYTGEYIDFLNQAGAARKELKQALFAPEGHVVRLRKNFNFRQLNRKFPERDVIRDTIMALRIMEMSQIVGSRLGQPLAFFEEVIPANSFPARFAVQVPTSLNAKTDQAYFNAIIPSLISIRGLSEKYNGVDPGTEKIDNQFMTSYRFYMHDLQDHEIQGLRAAQISLVFSEQGTPRGPAEIEQEVSNASSYAKQLLGKIDSHKDKRKLHKLLFAILHKSGTKVPALNEEQNVTLPSLRKFQAIRRTIANSKAPCQVEANWQISERANPCLNPNSGMSMGSTPFSKEDLSAYLIGERYGTLGFFKWASFADDYGIDKNEQKSLMETLQSFL